ncbi:shikimate kinase [Vibrio sp. SCSIO 43136]|uniref:shikimate kinase n=1 Tax=Vibrio sp. SCSIO 43136 TaxID=2819101 RepID=UPI00207611E9|nr:shikimate kinase [Vibrio sp. SCSIO 43136]USD66807.1 adenylate kinase [Vibrio sp. SCSIO 43136]
MKRINIVGTSGSGKSTFGRQIAQKLNYPYWEMDELFWQPNWVGSDDEAFFSKIEQATCSETWVLDGNYNRTRPVKWKNVDTVIWIDYSKPRTLYHAVTRAIKRIASQQEIWPDTGNKESFGKTFLSRDSILLWTIKTYASNRVRYLEVMSDPQYAHIEFIQLRSPSEAKQFLQSLEQRQSTESLG